MVQDARDIARIVSVPQTLRHLGWRTRHRNRADCGLCKGNSKGTVAFTDRLWRCHRCNEGGDVFSLVRAVRRCEFPDALRYVAEVGGVSLSGTSSAEVQHEIVLRCQQRERIACAVEKLAKIERILRVEFRDGIHRCDRVLHSPGPWSEAQWQRAAASFVLRDEFLLPAYTLLSFADPGERARYVLHPESREEIVARVQWAGYVLTVGGKRAEVLQ